MNIRQMRGKGITWRFNRWEQSIFETAREKQLLGSQHHREKSYGYGLSFWKRWGASTLVKKLFAAIGSALIVWACSATPSFALNGFINVSGCPNCRTSADFSAAAISQAVSQVKIGLFSVSSTNFAETAFVKVNGSIRLQCTGSPCTIKPGAQPYLTNVTTTFVDASGNSLAGESESALEASFLAIAQMLYANFRTQGKLGGPIKIAPAFGSSPIGNDVWEVDTSQGIGSALLGMGINQGNLPMGTLISVVWPDGTTAQFIRSNSVPTLQWVYVPGTMRNKAGQPITPVAGTTIQNPNSGGSGSGSANPALPAPSNLGLRGGATCTGTATLDDGSGTLYVFEFVFPC